MDHSLEHAKPPIRLKYGGRDFAVFFGLRELRQIRDRMKVDPLNDPTVWTKLLADVDNLPWIIQLAITNPFNQQNGSGPVADIEWIEQAFDLRDLKSIVETLSAAAGAKVEADGTLANPPTGPSPSP